LCVNGPWCDPLLSRQKSCLNPISSPCKQDSDCGLDPEDLTTMICAAGYCGKDYCGSQNLPIRCMQQPDGRWQADLCKAYCDKKICDEWNNTQKRCAVKCEACSKHMSKHSSEDLKTLWAKCSGATPDYDPQCMLGPDALEPIE